MEIICENCNKKLNFYAFKGINYYYCNWCGHKIQIN